MPAVGKDEFLIHVGPSSRLRPRPAGCFRRRGCCRRRGLRLRRQPRAKQLHGRRANRCPPAVTPADLSKNTPAKTNATATFSETMEATTIDAGSFVLVKRGTATPIGANVGYAAAAEKATLNPKRDLKPGVTYAASIEGGRRDGGRGQRAGPGQGLDLHRQEEVGEGGVRESAGCYPSPEGERVRRPTPGQRAPQHTGHRHDGGRMPTPRRIKPWLTLTVA
jgi:hypothetical protein